MSATDKASTTFPLLHLRLCGVGILGPPPELAPGTVSPPATFHAPCSLFPIRFAALRRASLLRPESRLRLPVSGGLMVQRRILFRKAAAPSPLPLPSFPSSPPHTPRPPMWWR
ncbi:hypothetical protein HPP92_003853 [Vanilla planifolia]|uniref:Uncharacterized protein n=1 Tax=Vanilla planifolia TaxID=51239 RepID=A0A835S4F8_VANPL|nr:hypothetical protein HPP92_003853 [Vanilla planifolia]